MEEVVDQDQTKRYSLGTELLLYLTSAFVGPPIAGIALFVGLRFREDAESRVLAINNLMLSLISAALFILVMALAP